MNLPLVCAALAVVSSARTAPASPDLEHAGGSPVSFAEHRDRVGADPSAGPIDWPVTASEASGYARTSRLDEVLRFVDELEGLPRAGRLQRRTIGRSNEGRELVAVTVMDDAPRNGALSHVIVNANIHGGEIEGKVAVQILLREFALGYHSELLESLAITFVPVFNVDGNDAIARSNRVTQNGPDGGVGERPNAQGLDLNRDFVKVESPEVEALLRLSNELSPIAFMDLHTTNGSAHGFDLTYAPSLSPNADPALDRYARNELLEGVRATLSERWGIETFDYGNFGYPPRQEARGASAASRYAGARTTRDRASERT